VAVAHELARLGARRGEAEPVHDVVEAPLEQHEQVLAGAALHVQRLVHRARELLLEQAVLAAHLLLLALLHAEVGEARAALAVLSGRIAAALDAALGGEAAGRPSGRAWCLPDGRADTLHRCISPFDFL
jgi:hypothetical protein